MQVLTPGGRAPDFELVDITGQPVRLSQVLEVASVAVVLDFWSVECSWSTEYDEWFAEVSEDWVGDGIVFLAIASNSNETFPMIAAAAKERKLGFPILHDKGAVVADMYGALTTPHIFVVDANGFLAYSGAIDDRTLDSPQATVNYLESALDALIRRHRPEPATTEPFGCVLVRTEVD
ncbi:MAG: redoxin domain-containing protein [Chloroflexota bacterium]|nr:redoxin domain-containing protein [Chloroflexota bacterium]